ncbi:uncharacterized protein LOC121384408 [Gigantopelta aegis]|uniref:uncharacterized protein LOC121384408 n=1 Tax=Gigantopelta aegis TaxID=1735272 RepID=UPI001B88A264|nr:uncharacterized protein LOC121384408 [Gigantopelta aegis]
MFIGGSGFVMNRFQHCCKLCLLVNMHKIPRQMTSGLFTSRHVLSNDDKSVSRFPVPDMSTLPQDLQHRFGNSKFIPNAFRALAYRPVELRAFLFYNDVLMQGKGNITKADKEMIAVTVSSENKCLYCVITHGALHRMQSKNPLLADQLSANWKCADLDTRQKAILEFAMEICHSRSPSEELYQKLYDQGLTQDDAWDIGTIAAFISFSNRLAHLTEMKPNEEFHYIGRAS